MRTIGLTAAIDAVGGVSALARALGVDPSTVSKWTRIPAERVAAASAATSLPSHVLRPDLFRIGLAEAQAPLAPPLRQSGTGNERARRWYDENREAIEAHNRYIEENGVPLAEYRMF